MNMEILYSDPLYNKTYMVITMIITKLHICLLIILHPFIVHRVVFSMNNYKPRTDSIFKGI